MNDDLWRPWITSVRIYVLKTNNCTMKVPERNIAFIQWVAIVYSLHKCLLLLLYVYAEIISCPSVIYMHINLHCTDIWSSFLCYIWAKFSDSVQIYIFKEAGLYNHACKTNWLMHVEQLNVHSLFAWLWWF